MNKTIIAILIVVVLLGGGAALYIASQKNESSASESMQQNSDDTAMELTEDGEISGSFLDLLKLGKSYTCDFDHTDETGNSTSGKVYVTDSGDKLNGEFEITTVDGTVISSNVIRDDMNTYVWSSALPQGYVFANPEGEDDLFAELGENAENNALVDANAKIDFDCNPWVVTDSMFVPPADIKFVSMSDAVESMMQNLGDDDGSYNMCESCNLIEDADAKAQCLQTFNC